MTSEHMVIVSVKPMNDRLKYAVTLTAEIPILACRDSQDYIVDYRKEITFTATPRRLTRKLNRKLLLAQKRYNKFLQFDEMEYSPTQRFNLTHKL